MSQIVEKHHQILLAKLKAKNFEFDEEDKCILELHPEYYKTIIEILASNIECWNEKIFESLNDEELLGMDPKIQDDFWLNYTKFLYNNKITIEENIIDTVLTMFPLKEETKEEMTSLLTMQQKENPEPKNTSISIEQLTKLYEDKRFDLISKIDYEIYSIPDKLMAAIMTEFPYDQYESPILFAKYQEIFRKTVNDLNKLSIKTLIKMAEESIYSYSYNVLYSIQQIMIYINSRLKKLKYSEPTLLPVDIDSIKIYLKSDKYELSGLVFENNNLSLLPYALECNQGTKEQQKYFIIEYINQKKGLDKPLKENLERLDIKKDEEIINCLIENDCIYFLLDNNLIEPNSEKEQTIINNILNNHPNYNNIGFLYLTQNIVKYPNIIQTIIDNYTITEIKLESYKENKRYEYTDEIHNILIEIMRKKPNISIRNLQELNNSPYLEELLNLFFDNKMYDRIISIIDNINNLFYNKENLEKYLRKYNDDFKKIFNESLYFPKKLLNLSNYTILESPSLLKLYCENEYSAQILIDYINHHEECMNLYTHELFLDLLDIFVAKYNINKERLLKIEELFGPQIIRYIENENIQTILKYPDENFEKLMALFLKLKFTMKDIEASYDSLKQYEFSKRYPEEISIFPSILHAIEDNDEEKLKECIEKIAPLLDDKIFQKIKDIYVLPEEYNQSNPNLFLLFVIAKIKNSEDSKREKYINLLHVITDYYISRKREDYRKIYSMETELELPYSLNPKSIETELIKYYIKNCSTIAVKNPNKQNNFTSITLKECLIKKMISNGVEPDLASSSLEYYIKGDEWLQNQQSIKYDSNTLKKEFKSIIKAMKEIAKEQKINQSEDYIIKSLDSEHLIKREYYPDTSDINIYELLANLKLDILEECVLNDEEVYNSLRNLMIKRKIHLLPYSLKRILNSEFINISDDFNNIAAFISYYAQIYKKEKSALASNNKSTDNILINLVNILINSEVYSSVSSVYTQVLGDIDTKLIKGNPRPNSASMKLANNERLKEAVEFTIKNFRRQVVTIPTFNEIFTLSNKKKIQIIAGNFNHPSNLTHGERTGACMRIGGVGETLFNFCLENPNGFHIRFVNPQDGEYISRVSGFRNGNTVFLNELRYSCNPELYNNNDIIESCKEAAKYLIELSKGSSLPIANVVIHRAYATSDMPEENITLDKKNIKEGLPPFYSDVSNNVIVLATTAQNSEFVPLDFNKSKVPEYLPAREKPLISEDIQKIGAKIIRIETMKRILAGENYEYVEHYEFKEGLIYAVATEDWYIYIDEKGNIHHNIIDIDPRAKEELAEYLIRFETDFKNGINKENIYGNK